MLFAVSDDVGPEPLQLCDCEPARGPPNGLSCDKEGWFISSFERVGEWVSCYLTAFVAPGCTGSPSPGKHAILTDDSSRPREEALCTACIGARHLVNH